MSTQSRRVPPLPKITKAELLERFQSIMSLVDENGDPTVDIVGADLELYDFLIDTVWSDKANTPSQVLSSLRWAVYDQIAEQVVERDIENGRQRRSQSAKRAAATRKRRAAKRAAVFGAPRVAAPVPAAVTEDDVARRRATFRIVTDEAE